MLCAAAAVIPLRSRARQSRPYVDHLHVYHRTSVQQPLGGKHVLRSQYLAKAAPWRRRYNSISGCACMGAVHIEQRAIASGADVQRFGGVREKRVSPGQYDFTPSNSRKDVFVQLPRLVQHRQKDRPQPPLCLPLSAQRWIEWIYAAKHHGRRRCSGQKESAALPTGNPCQTR